MKPIKTLGDGILSEKKVPMSLVVDQVSAYRYAFIEAILKANRAIKQRDYFHDLALKSTCEAMEAKGCCPLDVDDPCPAFFGGYCKACRCSVESKARYL